ncbi:MAG: pyrophosphate--fructose 6-phosphate 1-phosphotransferase [Gemmatales bacterium]|nr:MAG: pyrophosphate--fructose 6-phosphate 1-phosphotransferase [Gemmatales bacterium]
MSASTNLKRLGILVGGGPAPGINSAISAVAIEANNHNIEVIGFLDGFKWLVRDGIEWSDPECPYCRRLTIDDVKQIHLRGGSILGTSRTNPTQQLEQVLRAFREMEIDALVTIGGDDTAYSAHQVYLAAKGALRVAHIPKTIDNDLPLPGSTPTFGFETARHVGTMLVSNLAEDARTTGRWYLVVSMGRAAGHLALGIGTASAATLTLIPEEFGFHPVPIKYICDTIIGSIIKRSQKRNYGVVVLAEGLIEAIGEQALVEAMKATGTPDRYGDIKRDEHGHLRLGEIEFGRMMKDLLSVQLKNEFPMLQTTFIDKDLGYELRCARPIPFDIEYTRNLGYGAVKFLRSERASQSDAMIAFVDGRMHLMAFEEFLNPQTKRALPRKVSPQGEAYECARRYMIRLEKRDFDNPETLRQLAASANMEPEAFRNRFGYLVGA